MPFLFRQRAPLRTRDIQGLARPECRLEGSGSFRIYTPRSVETLAVKQKMTQTAKKSDFRVWVVPGVGFHDVVIETPVHSVHLSDLGPTQVGEVLLAYKKRIEQIKERDLIKYVQYDEALDCIYAGFSTLGMMARYLALPVIPPTVSGRLCSMKEYFDQTGKCGLCEVQPEDLLIDETTYFTSIVPFAATFPFEIWIIPRYHSSHFHDLDSEKAIDLGGLLKLMLRKLSMQLNNPPFNFMIHTSPLQVTDSQSPYTHWYLQIVPQLTGVGGFEIGTGCYINPVFPDDAAKVLREVNIPV
ncbi:hypothetical protein Pint_20167 [Pistacia integerrima]|uniref:Uncharacterized protein n=1 Tax=Pistacia integerrima TaxID=434235 RepID=A0ACC0XDS9_9ROSI|nr:hypothetical protein Pint_20167 [Pistacia integerrima]